MNKIMVSVWVEKTDRNTRFLFIKNEQKDSQIQLPLHVVKDEILNKDAQKEPLVRIFSNQKIKLDRNGHHLWPGLKNRVTVELQHVIKGLGGDGLLIAKEVSKVLQTDYLKNKT